MIFASRIEMEVLLWKKMGLVFILSVWISVCSAANSKDQKEEAQALLEFKKLLTSDSQGVLHDWLPNNTHNFCHWKKINCSSTGRVTKIDLYSAGIGGTISPALSNLPYLNYLDLCNNSFTGQIPSELGRLKNLQTLYLCANELSGAIPKSLTSLRRLEVLSVEENSLEGSIPEGIGRISSLQILSLHMNNINGSIPPSIANLSSLEFLSIYETKIQGSLPSDIGKLRNLQSLMLFENPLLTGPVPESFCNLTSLFEVDMHQNSFTGQVPLCLDMLKEISVLYLWGNKFIGIIPPSLGNCSKLKRLDFDKNQLSGAVPKELGRLPLFETFTATGNRLVSNEAGMVSILSELSNCSKLQVLDLSFNNLTGVLPEQLPRNLSELRLNGNRIRGSIPWEALSKLENLFNLDLSSNLLTGNLSTSVSKLKNLQRLALDDNSLEGTVPSEVGQLGKLSELSISRNDFSGELPHSIGNLNSLRRLLVHHNRFSGRIPASLQSCYRLELVDLSANALSGAIPPEAVDLLNIQFYFNLSRNSLEGRLPSEIGKMTHATAIDVSDNKFNGSIPAGLGDCEQLQFLNLSSNAFQGSIPKSLTELSSLVSIDLSRNNLSGTIPSEFQNLTALRSLNFSFNDLSGEVPEEGVFRKLTSQSFLGNPSLCGNIAELAHCSSGDSNSSDKIKIIAPIAAVVGAVLLGLIIFFFFIRRRSKKGKIDRANHDSILWERKIMNSTNISYEEIYQATDGFSRESLLGSSTLGSVYRGMLTDGTLVAVKILNPGNEEAFKHFRAEFRALSKVKHRNLVKIRGVCSDSRCKALVLQLMAEGSLEEALKKEELKVREMISILKDVANGLEYLHHHCEWEIVHCDIKPSNVLLDDDMVAHVADFGISRLLSPTDSTDSLVSTLILRGSIGYIPPEYGGGGMVSTKGDVYSFGVMVLEMVTGRSPSDEQLAAQGSLHGWVGKYFPDKIEEILRRSVIEEVEEEEGGYVKECVRAMVRIGMMCTHVNPANRPSMSQVVTTLSALS